MRLISYDCEVFAYDWLVTLKDKETGVYTCIWNDNEALKMALSDDCIYVGFNSKHYDQYIIKAIAAGFATEEIDRSVRLAESHVLQEQKCRQQIWATQVML